MNRFTNVVIAVLLAAGCSKGASDRPASVSDDLVATADKYAGALEKFSTDLEAAGSDCGKALDAVKASTEVGRGLAADIDAVRSKTMSDAAAKTWFQHNYEARMRTAFDKVKSAARTCEHDAAFMTAIEADVLLPRKTEVKK